MASSLMDNLPDVVKREIEKMKRTEEMAAQKAMVHASMAHVWDDRAGGYVGGGGGAGVHSHVYTGVSGPSVPQISSAPDRLMMIATRLRVSLHNFPFQKIATFENGEKVVVFVIAGGQPVVLEDDASLFPSDTLVSQLRLLPND